MAETGAGDGGHAGLFEQGVLNLAGSAGLPLARKGFRDPGQRGSYIIDRIGV